MQRRSFMQSMLLASLAAAGRPGFLRAEVLAPTGPERFAAGLAREPWLAGWKSVERRIARAHAGHHRRKLAR